MFDISKKYQIRVFSLRKRYRFTTTYFDKWVSVSDIPKEHKKEISDSKQEKKWVSCYKELPERVLGKFPSNLLIYWPTQPCINQELLEERWRILHRWSDNAQCIWRSHNLFNIFLQPTSVWADLFSNQVSDILRHYRWIIESNWRCFPQKTIQNYNDADCRQWRRKLKKLAHAIILV